MNNIETGYKPQWGLGAVYAGENAANAEDLNQQELIKQYLLNQREVKSQPLDMDVKGLQAAQARVQNDPNVLNKFLNSTMGKYDSDIAKGKKDTELLESDIASGKSTNIFSKMKNDAGIELQEVNKVINSGMDSYGNPLTPEQISIMNQKRDSLMKVFADTPEARNKMAELGITDKMHRDIAAGNNATSLEVARINAQRGDAQADKAYRGSLVTMKGQIESALSQSNTQLTNLAKEMEGYKIFEKINKKMTLDPAESRLLQTFAEVQNRIAELKGKNAYLDKIIGMPEMQGTPAPTQAPQVQQPTQTPPATIKYDSKGNRIQ